MLQICDSRNWGVEPPEDVRGAGARARWLRAVMCRMVALLRQEKLGALCVTAGAQAVHTWRRRYLTHKVQIHTDPDALALEERALYGGRCEAFYVGEIHERIYHLDYRSLYPSCCVRGVLPALLRGAALLDPAALVAEPDRLSRCIVDVTVRSAEGAYPLRRKGECTFPTGEYRTVLCGPEVCDARDRGRVVAIHRAVEYELSPCLRAACEALYAILDRPAVRADEPIALWLKRVLNSVHGKLGQRGGTWCPYLNAPPHAPWTTWTVSNPLKGRIRCRDIAGQAEWERPARWGDSAVPALAAWITSLGRVELLRAIRTAGWREVYYVDTDSLLTSAAGLGRLNCAGLVGDGLLGKLRVVGVHRAARVWGPKHYSLDGMVVCAGRPRGAVCAGPVEGSYWFTDSVSQSARAGRTPEVVRVLRPFLAGLPARKVKVGPDGWVIPEEV